jgi:hypothetical protein
MSVSRDPVRDDRHLVRYLLGCLDDDESEWLDEQSIVDDDVAAQLRLAESELVDAYVRGTLSGDWLERFESVYLTSSHRRGKVAFAKRLLAAVDRAGAGASGPVAPEPGSGADQTVRATADPPAHQRVRRPSRFWPLTAAAVVLLGAGVLFILDGKSQQALREALRQEAAADQRVHALMGQIESQRAANTSLAQELARLRAAPPIVAVALVLAPQTRGIGRPPRIAVRPGTRTVPLALQVEGADYSGYRVSLRDPATNRILWRSPMLVPGSSGRPPTVPVEVPASLLEPQHYSLELSARRSTGAPEIVGTYVFQVVPQ